MKTHLNKRRRINQHSPAEDISFDPDNNKDMWVLLDQAHFAVARSRFMELAQYKLTKEQAQILYVLRIYGGSATMNQIASFTLRQRHSVSTLVNRMEKVGLLKKVKVNKEKVFKVIVTKKGKERYESVPQESIEMVFSTLSTADKRKFGLYLNKLQKKARSLLGLDYKPPFLKRRAKD